jgi:hypothetical protein
MPCNCFQDGQTAKLCHTCAGNHNSLGWDVPCFIFYDSELLCIALEEDRRQPGYGRVPDVPQVFAKVNQPSDAQLL